MKKIVLSVLVLMCLPAVVQSQHAIKGHIHLDTSKWAPFIYLSLIPDFSEINTISRALIIQKAIIHEDGYFELNSGYLPEEDHLYRLHISKLGDPSASLIIGGKDHNHMFLIAKKNCDIELWTDRAPGLFSNYTIKGYPPNTALTEVNSIIGLLDSLDYLGGDLNHDYIREAVNERLREFADTCNQPLVSLFALYESDFKQDKLVNPSFYSGYLQHWSGEESKYFTEFRNDLDLPQNRLLIYSVIGAFVVLICVFAFVWIRKVMRKKTQSLSSLTVQEHKILIMLKQGKSNKEIAEEYSISVSTVKTHTNSIYSKLGVGSRKEILDIDNPA